MRTICAATCALILLAACARSSPRTVPTSPLLASIQAAISGDSVHFLLQVTNTGAQPVEVEFASGRISEFVVQQGAVELWNSNSGLAYTQALHIDTIAAGDTRSFQASWKPPLDARGEMWVTGVLQARNPLQQSARFRLP